MNFNDHDVEWAYARANGLQVCGVAVGSGTKLNLPWPPHVKSAAQEVELSCTISNAQWCEVQQSKDVNSTLPTNKAILTQIQTPQVSGRECEECIVATL